MEFCRTAARAARGGFATATALPTRLPARMATVQRPFSTTAPRCALPPPPPPPPPPSRSSPSSVGSRTPSASSAAPWPPTRDPARPAASSAAAAAPRKGAGAGAGAGAAAAADPLKDLYSSENPAQWALWSTDDFYKRHLGSSGADSPKQHLRLRPTTGRTVHVSGNVDQARAFALAEALVRRNRIKHDHIRQRFHERPGLRRKRLRSQRWGARFRENFIATAARVKALAAQGW